MSTPALAALLFAFSRPSWAVDMSGGGFILSDGAMLPGGALSGTGGLLGFGLGPLTCNNSSASLAGGGLTGRCGNVNLGVGFLDHTLSHVFQSGNSVLTVSIPANAVPLDYETFLITDPTTAPQRVSSSCIEQANAKLQGTHGAGFGSLPSGIVEINVLQETEEFLAADLSRNATLRFTYADADNNGIVDGTNPPLRASTIKVARLDEVACRWELRQGTVVDTVAKTASEAVPHFSVYAMIATAAQDVSAVYAFPVPWSPNSGDPALGNRTDGIRFTNLPTLGSVRIFNLAGQLVRSLDIPLNAGTLSWNVKNMSGEDVVSGVYIWIVQSGSNKKTGKLMVIR